MGMYTELFISTQLTGLDPVSVEALRYMAGLREDCPTILPDHKLFKTPRWSMLFQGSSYYFVPRSMRLFEFDDIANGWVLISRADLKNYHEEIELFLEWINPYHDREAGSFIGYSRYEEVDEPTLHYVQPTS